jgi:hypothetical protein
MEIWTIISTLTGTVATVVVIVGALYARRQLREATESRNVNLLLALRERYHSPAARSIRRRLLAGDLGGPDEFDFEALPDEDFHDLWDLLDQLELVGILIERGLLEPELVLATFHRSPPLVWVAVRAEVERRRGAVPNECKQLEFVASLYSEPDPHATI